MAPRRKKGTSPHFCGKNFSQETTRIIMSTGTVKFFNDAKGFGFITPDDGDKDLFVHTTAVESGQLYENDKVEFEIGEGQKGPCAVNVRKI